MSIQSFRFANLFAQLAEDVGLYEALDLDLDDIDTSILEQVSTMEAGDVEEVAIESSEGRPDEGDVEAADQDMATPAPATPTFEMAFTSSSLDPIKPVPEDELAIMNVDLTTGAGMEARDTLTHMPDFMVHSLTQLSWLGKCGVGVAGYDARPGSSSGGTSSSLQVLSTHHSVQQEGSPQVLASEMIEAQPSPISSSARRGPSPRSGAASSAIEGMPR